MPGSIPEGIYPAVLLDASLGCFYSSGMGGCATLQPCWGKVTWQGLNGKADVEKGWDVSCFLEQEVSELEGSGHHFPCGGRSLSNTTSSWDNSKGSFICIIWQRVLQLVAFRMCVIVMQISHSTLPTPFGKRIYKGPRAQANFGWAYGPP